MTESLKHISVFALLGMILAGCDGAHDMPGTIGNPVAADITARIGAASRASGTSWGDDDRIGISGVSGSEAYVNEEYRIADRKTGRFTAVGAGIFYQTTAPVTFTAYYPFTGSAAPGQAPVITGNTRADSQTAAAQPDIDYLWAQASGDYKTPVDFTFHHRMSRLSLTFTNGEGIDVSEITAYSIEGLKMTGTFDTATGTASATGAAETLTISDPSLTSLILYPQATGGNMKIKTVIAGQSYSCMPEITELNPGVDYAYTIRVSKTGLTVSSCTISDWNDGGSFSGDATMPVLKPNVGDYYYSDGTYSSEYDATKNVIGIIFYVGHHPKDGSDYSDSAIGEKECHGYVMALSNADRWGISWLNIKDTAVEIEGISFNTDDWNGYANQKAIEHYANNNQKGIAFPNFEAAYMCSIYGTSESEDHSQFRAPDKSSGWFLPSVGQFAGFHVANCAGSNLLNNKIDAVKSASDRIHNLRYATPWCSTMKEHTSAYYVFFPEADSGNLSVSPHEISGTVHVRAMLAF